MWNLEKWYRWTYLQSRNKRHRYREPMYGYQEEGGRWYELGVWDWHIYNIYIQELCKYKIGN